MQSNGGGHTRWTARSAAAAARITPWQSHGSVTSTKAHRPKPPWLLTAGTHRVRAVLVFAALSFRASPDTSTISVRSGGPERPAHTTEEAERHARVTDAAEK